MEKTNIISQTRIPTRRGFILPDNDIELAEYEAEKKRLRPNSLFNTRMSINNQHLIDQVSPFSLYRSSPSWSTQRPRGFGQDDIHSYIVRQSDVQQASLFDRYILGNGECPSSGISLGKRIVERYGEPTRNSIKQRFRGKVKGSMGMRPDELEKKRWAAA